MAQTPQKIEVEDLESVLNGSTPKTKKKKVKKSTTKSLAKKKTKKKVKGSSTTKSILKSKKAPLSVVKKTGASRQEEIEKWLSTESGFLEGFTEDVFGNPTRLYKYQIKFLDDLSYFIHIDKSRQCLPEGSIVYTPNGPIRIEELHPGDSIYSYNQEKDIIEVDYVKEAWESGIRSCRRIYTRAGNGLEAGINHPFLMEDGFWFKNRHLEKGDELKHIKGSFGFENPSRAKVLLLAYFITDGYTVTQAKFTNNDKRLIKDFMKAVRVFDPSLSFRTVKKENGYETFPHAGHGTCEKNKIHRLLERWDFRGKRKEHKFLPREVFRWNKKSQRLLLNRIFCCDGWYNCPEGEVSGVGIGTSNRKFAYQIQQLLWNFGIDSRVRQTVSGHEKYLDFWKVLVGYRGAISIFYDEIGIASKQNIPLKEYKHHTRPRNRVFSYHKKTGKKRCFDISVEKNKNFIFEGFVVHNTGFSYVYAGRSVARSHLHHYHTSIFISINQEEANEKIGYARALYESLPLSVKKKCIVDNKQSLEFEDKNGKKSSRTRIISHAQREPRGKGGNVDVYLDEAAHYTWGDKIYVAAVPIITRGTGTLVIGSSPLGKKGIHYEIGEREAFRKIYSFHRVYWWNCIDFVKNGVFKKAQKEAPYMQTAERVDKFGSEKLIAVFLSAMSIEEFQQEYELLHIDESVSFFPIDLINKCVYEIVVDPIFMLDDAYSEKLEFPIEEKHPNIDFKLYDDLESLQRAVFTGKVSEKLYAGYDVGRKKDAGELVILEETKGNLQTVRHLVTFKNKKFKYQKAYLKECLDKFPRLRMKIDSGGIGEDMSEELSDYSWRVEPIHFTNDWKEETCADFRIRLEEQLIALPNRKDVKAQIHSIKRKVTESGKFTFDAEKNRDHHGDIFWAITMASSLGPRPSRAKIVIPIQARQKNVKDLPRVIPISSSRSFTKFNMPTMIPPSGLENLKSPSNLINMHRRISV